MWPASRSFFSFFFRFESERGKRTLIHHCWSSAHLPDDASTDDFSACLKMHEDDRSNNCLYGYLRTKQTSAHWISLRCHAPSLPNKRGARAGESRDLTIRQRRRPWKRRWKTDLRIILNFFTIIPIHPVTLKEGDFGWSWERGTRSSSDRDGRFYRLALPVPK